MMILLVLPGCGFNLPITRYLYVNYQVNHVYGRNRQSSSISCFTLSPHTSLICVSLATNNTFVFFNVSCIFVTKNLLMIPIGFIYIKNVTKFTNYACNVQKSENWIHDPIFQKKVFIFYKGGVIMMHATYKILKLDS